MARIPRAAADKIRRLLFHGSGADFDQFDPAYIGSGDGASFQGRGFYLTPDQMLAEKYARDHMLQGPVVVDFGHGFKASPEEFDGMLRDIGADDETIRRAKEHLNNMIETGQTGPMDTGIPELDEWISGVQVRSTSNVTPHVYGVELDPRANLMNANQPIADAELLEYLATHSPRITPETRGLEAYGFAGQAMGEENLNNELLRRGIYGMEVPGGRDGQGGIVTIFDPSVLTIRDKYTVD